MKKGCLKKLIAGVLAAALITGGASAAGYVKAAAKPKLNKTKVSIKKGKTVKLKLKNNKKKVTWKTSNKKIATVSKKGVVKGIKKGKAVITASIKVTKKKTRKFKCKVTVTENKKASSNSSNSNSSPTTAKLPNLDKIKIGMSSTQVSSLLGNPVRKDASPKGFSVWVYINKTYSQYMLINIDGNKVVGMSGMSSDISYGNVLPAGTNRDTLESSNSGWSEVKWYSATNVAGANKGIAAYSKKLDDETVIAFTDYYESGQKVYFVQVFSSDYSIDDMTKPDKSCVYNDKVMRGMESEIVEMLSVYRVMHGLSKYTRLGALDKVALAESKSMAESKLSKAEIRSKKEYLMEMIKNGCDPTFYAEDTAVGLMDAVGFFNYLIELEEAQQNLLAMDGNKPKLSMIGVGCDFVLNSSKYYVYLTVDYCSDDYK